MTALLLYMLVISQDVMVSKTFKGIVCKTCKDACIKDLLSKFQQHSLESFTVPQLSKRCFRDSNKLRDGGVEHTGFFVC